MEDARPRVAAAALALLSAFVLATCGAPGAPSRDEIVDSRDNYDPRSLDPALSTDVPTGRAVAYLFDGLTRFTPEARVEPSLATRWEISPDGRRYTFHLRTDVSFHDGSHFTARNVVASWERALAPATKSGAAQFLFPIAGARAFNGGTAKSISGLAAPNDSTVVVTLDEPLAIFTKMLAMPVASVVPLNTPANFGEHPIGTGPWTLVTWKHDDFLLFAQESAVLRRRAKGRLPPRAHHRRAEHGGRRVRERKRRRAADSCLRSERVGERREPLVDADVDAGARAGVHRYQHDTRSVGRPARPPGDQLRDRCKPHH